MQTNSISRTSSRETFESDYSVPKTVNNSRLNNTIPDDERSVSQVSTITDRKVPAFLDQLHFEECYAKTLKQKLLSFFCCK